MQHQTRTKIVATIGPASQSQATLVKMMNAGMRVARLNFSHGDYKSHAQFIKNIRVAAKKVGIEVAILQDLQGPRIRVANVQEEGVAVRRGMRVALVGEKYKDLKIKGNQCIPIQYEELYRDVKKGTLILIEDGTLQLKVINVRDKIIYCNVKISGTIKSHKGINVPGVTLSVQVITEKDKNDIKFGQQQEVDYVALSFVKDAQNIRQLKQLIKKYQKKGTKIATKTIAKIERQEALNNLSAILAEVDGIMVARGDLGIEIKAEEVPVWQKIIIEKCLEKAKPVIVATQMLDSMIRNPQPTRAEVSDVANAVIDHTDAIMLSGESATGNYPVEAVAMMTRISAVTEESHYDDYLCGPKRVQERGSAVALAACHIHLQTRAKAAIVFSTSGDSVRYLSRHRPELPIVALTPELKTQRQLALSWGVITKKVSSKASLKTMINQGIKLLKEQDLVKKGDLILVAGGDPFGKIPEMNTVKVIKIGEPIH